MVNGAEPNMIGADGSDTLNGGPGMDVLLGNDGHDELDGGPGPDEMHGDNGKDSVSYEHRSNPVTVTLNNLPDDGEDGEGDNVFADIEAVLGGTVGDTLTGDRDPNTLSGGTGEDYIVGYAGSDALRSGSAPDLIDARDGQRDAVNCGDDGDLAVVDRRDQVDDCETVDPGGTRRLVVGRWALVRPAPSAFELRLPSGTRFYPPFREAVKIPLRSTIDPRGGRVRLVMPINRAGARQELSISGSRFSVDQEPGRAPVTKLRLRGCGAAACSGASTSRAAATNEPARRIFTRIERRKKRRKGKQPRVEVRGRYSIGAAVGTAWWTEDRAEGTLTRVVSGTVRVRDLESDRTVIVKAGHPYLARPR
jgi:hypothetical protein